MAAGSPSGMEQLRAIGEERRAAFAEIEAAHIDLRQERDELCGRATLAIGEPNCFSEKFAISELNGRGVRHSLV